jgi:hypothetical protein
MAVPTITSISPVTGPSVGFTLAEVVGTNFRVTPDPPPTGPVPPHLPTVSVLFGTVAAREVKVLSTTLLTALTPAHDVGLVSLVVKNLDDAGVPISGETATKTSAFTFGRPDLTQEPVIKRVFRALLRAMKQAVHPNVVPMVHTEFDDVPGGVEVAMLAALPGLTLGGPDVVEDREYATNEEQDVEEGDATFRSMRVTETESLLFALTGAAEKQGQLLALLDATKDFFDKVKWVTMDRDPVTPSLGTVSYPLMVPRAPGFRVTSKPNEANVFTFSGTILVRGVTREGMAGVANDLRRERGGRTSDDGATIQVDRVG